MKGWFTGQELMDRWGEHAQGLCFIMAGGLTAYDPETHDILTDIGIIMTKAWLEANCDPEEGKEPTGLGIEERKALLSLVPNLHFHCDEVICFENTHASLKKRSQLDDSNVFKSEAISGVVNASANDPEELIAKLRIDGIKDASILAAKVDEAFPGLSDAGIGKLLQANPGASITWDGHNTRGRRLRGKK